ncbi:MAG: DUF4097 family beta strand repeat-containing protein [Candidatus Muiribacteriota bacterium]
MKKLIFFIFLFCILFNFTYSEETDFNFGNIKFHSDTNENTISINSNGKKSFQIKISDEGIFINSPNLDVQIDSSGISYNKGAEKSQTDEDSKGNKNQSLNGTNKNKDKVKIDEDLLENIEKSDDKGFLPSIVNFAKSVLKKFSGIEDENKVKKSEEKDNNSKKNKSFSTETAMIELAESFKAGNIDKIEISLICSELFLIESDKHEQIEVTWSGEIEAEDAKTRFKPQIKNDNNKLSVIMNAGNRKDLNIKKSNLKINMFIPSKKLNNVKAENISGNINSAAKINVNNVEFSNNSGDIYVGNIKSDFIKLKNISGDIKIEKLEYNKLDINSTSGDVKLMNLKGNEKLIKTTSGDIKIVSKGKHKKNEIETVSGDIYFQLSKNNPILFEYKTTSGSLSNMAAFTVENSGKNNYQGFNNQKKGGLYKFETVSGKLYFVR